MFTTPTTYNYNLFSSILGYLLESKTKDEFIHFKLELVKIISFASYMQEVSQEAYLIIKSYDEWRDEIKSIGEIVGAY